jgi:3-oxoacyl-[acyl-carrier-protein] synthase II
MTMTPVPIAGIGCLCAAGLTLPRCMETLYAGRRHPTLPTRFRTRQALPFPVFEIRQPIFDDRPSPDPRVLRTGQLALKAALEAVDDAAMGRRWFRDHRVGVCIGTNVGSAMNNEAFYRDNTEGCDPYIAPVDRFLMSNPTSAIARKFEVGGPCQTVVNACSAGSDAVGIAASWINSGICDAVLAGGADELYQVTYTGFKSLFINADSPCKPFDADRSGLNLGEGAAVFVLVSDSLRREYGLASRGYVLGYGSASDAFHFTKPRPDGKGLKLAIDEAMHSGGIASGQVAFVNAHGTGTRDNDWIESVVLAERFPDVPFLSTKGYTGHTLGASGAIEAAFSVACLEQGRIPASIGFSTPDPELPASPVDTVTTVNGRVALSQTLAFGGNNAVLVLGKGDR